MKIITAYQCDCGEVYTKIERIEKCKNCGKEICPECASMNINQCWECYEKDIKGGETSEEKQNRYNCCVGNSVSGWSCYKDCAFWDGKKCTNFEV